jgi:ribosomal protein S9
MFNLTQLILKKTATVDAVSRDLAFWFAAKAASEAAGGEPLAAGSTVLKRPISASGGGGGVAGQAGKARHGAALNKGLKELALAKRSEKTEADLRAARGAKV